MEWICKECEADNYLCECVDKRIKKLEVELKEARAEVKMLNDIIKRNNMDKPIFKTTQSAKSTGE